MHRATRRFWEFYNELPDVVQKIAQRNFEFLKKDSKHPSLYFKKVGKFWSARVGLDHRALAIEDGEDFIWVWIGAHDEYDR
ncbi:MAG: hypothetical protein HY257_11040, partial [Chloroflexi bacterium]|nr:hypothetical protein [Chloroflexota bacterium]